MEKLYGKTCAEVCGYCINNELATILQGIANSDVNKDTTFLLI